MGSTSSYSVANATPPHRQSYLLQLVTQWKSLTSSTCGRALNWVQSSVAGFLTKPSMASVHWCNGISGFTPRSSTGNPVVRVCPGGRRSVDAAARGATPCACCFSAQRRFASIYFCRSIGRRIPRRLACARVQQADPLARSTTSAFDRTSTSSVESLRMTLSTVERVRAPSGVEGLALGDYGTELRNGTTERNHSLALAATESESPWCWRPNEGWRRGGFFAVGEGMRPPLVFSPATALNHENIPHARHHNRNAALRQRFRANSFGPAGMAVAEDPANRRSGLSQPPPASGGNERKGPDRHQYRFHGQARAMAGGRIHPAGVCQCGLGGHQGMEV